MLPLPLRSVPTLDLCERRERSLSLPPFVIELRLNACLNKTSVKLCGCFLLHKLFCPLKMETPEWMRPQLAVLKARVEPYLYSVPEYEALAVESLRLRQQNECLTREIQELRLPPSATISRDRKLEELQQKLYSLVDENRGLLDRDNKAMRERLDYEKQIRAERESASKSASEAAQLRSEVSRERRRCEECSARLHRAESERNRAVREARQHAEDMQRAEAERDSMEAAHREVRNTLEAILAQTKSRKAQDSEALNELSRDVNTLKAECDAQRAEAHRWRGKARQLHRELGASQARVRTLLERGGDWTAVDEDDAYGGGIPLSPVPPTPVPASMAASHDRSRASGSSQGAGDGGPAGGLLSRALQAVFSAATQPAGARGGSRPASLSLDSSAASTSDPYAPSMISAVSGGHGSGGYAGMRTSGGSRSTSTASNGAGKR